MLSINKEWIVQVMKEIGSQHNHAKHCGSESQLEGEMFPALIQWSRNKIKIYILGAGGGNSQNVLSVRHGDQGCLLKWDTH